MLRLQVPDLDVGRSALPNTVDRAQDWLNTVFFADLLSTDVDESELEYWCADWGCFVRE